MAGRAAIPTHPYRLVESIVSSVRARPRSPRRWLVLYLLPDVDGAQRIRALLQAVFVFTGAIVFAILTMAASNGDTWALIVEGLLAVGVVLAVAGGWMLRPVAAA